MAEQTLTLNMTQAAYVTSFAPDETGPLNAGDTVALNQHGKLLLRFDNIPAALKYKRLVRVESILIHPTPTSFTFYMRGLMRAFNKGSVTWNTMPTEYYGLHDYVEIYYGAFYDREIVEMYPSSADNYPKERAKLAKYILSNSCVAITLRATSQTEYTLQLARWNGYSEDPSIPPQIKIIYDDSADVASKISLTGTYSGHIDRTKAKTFSWTFEPADTNAVCAGDFTQQSATLYWKVKGDTNYTAVPATGSTQSVTIPANTFPSGVEIEGYIEGTDNAGTTSTATFSINTIDATAIATVTSPLNTVEDGGAEITFRWDLSNAYGNDPSRVNLWWKLPSEDNQSWHVLISSTDPITEYTVPANTFPAGEIQWLVHAYNQDNVRGPDSQGSFICVAAPAAPNGISADGVPYTTIRWQCEGQQAYHIVIDGKDYGTQFGTAKSITMEEPLGEGEHTVTITAQGVYGLWSQPGTMTFTVTNTPGDSVTLIGTEGADAVLTWETTSTVSDFYIYRDDIRIGHTSGKSFADRLAVGTHSYYVLNKLADGNYTRSNTVTITLSTDDTLIAEFPPIEWLSIRLTENSEPQHQYSYQKTQTTRHFYGAEYPVLEDSSFADMSGSFDTAFIDAGQAERFEQLKGKAVVMKSKNGVFVGAMSTMQKTVRQFFTAYTFAMTRIHWEDYIDETNA